MDEANRDISTPPQVLTRGRLIFYRTLSVILVVVVVASTTVRTVRSPAKGDIAVIVDAARHLLEGKNIYDTPGRSGLPYLYPPLSAFLAIPLTLIHIDVVIVFWGILTTALLCWVFLACIRGMTGVSFRSLPSRVQWSVGFTAVLLNGRFIHHHLAVAQANVVVLAAAVLGLVWFSARKELLGGTTLGLSYVLKVLTVPFSIHFLARKSYRAIAGMALGIALGLSTPAVVSGVSRNVDDHLQWVGRVIVRNAPGSARWGDNSNASLQAQVYRFFSDQPAFTRDGVEHRFTIVNLSPATLRVVSWLLLLGVGGSMFGFAFAFRNEARMVSEWGSYAFTFALLPMFSTVSEKHHFLLLFPACVYVAYVLHALGLRDRRFLVLVGGSFALLTLTTDGIWGRLISETFTAVGCLAFGTLLLAGAVFRAAQCLSAKRL